MSLFLVGCSSLHYKKTTQESLPSLASIGDFKSYVLDTSIENSGVLKVSTPIKISVSKISINKRNFLTKKKQKTEEKLDSTQIKLTIIDKLSLLDQIKDNKDLLTFLKINSSQKIVTDVIIQFPNDIMNTLLEAEEVYLVQNKQTTLSLEIRKNNKRKQLVEFSEGIILNYEASYFCWGALNNQKIRLVDVSNNCSDGSSKSYKKVKQKATIQF